MVAESLEIYSTNGARAMGGKEAVTSWRFAQLWAVWSGAVECVTVVANVSGAHSRI